MDYCVICGSIVPEGTHVCINCIQAVLGKKQEPGVVMEEKSGYNGEKNRKNKTEE